MVVCGVATSGPLVILLLQRSDPHGPFEAATTLEPDVYV